MVAPEDQDAARLSAQSLASGDPTGWFDRLYAAAEHGEAIVPWDRDAPNALLVEWAAGVDGGGRRAVVVGCAYGRDAEFIASLGFDTSAFDISPSAVAAARCRHPDSSVRYEVADLLALPAAWQAAFDLVVESHNVQSMPPPLHAAAAAAVATLVADGGTLLVLAAAADGPPGAPPWPLTRDEVEAFGVGGVEARTIELVAGEVPRWRAEFGR